MVGVTPTPFSCSFLSSGDPLQPPPSTHTFLGSRGGAQPRQPSLNPLHPSLPTALQPTSPNPPLPPPPPNYEDQYTRKLARAAPTLLARRPPSSTDSLGELDLDQTIHRLMRTCRSRVRCRFFDCHRDTANENSFCF